jgi:hypothetical protein
MDIENGVDDSQAFITLTKDQIESVYKTSYENLSVVLYEIKDGPIVLPGNSSFIFHALCIMYSLLPTALLLTNSRGFPKR